MGDYFAVSSFVTGRATTGSRQTAFRELGTLWPRKRWRPACSTPCSKRQWTELHYTLLYSCAIGYFGFRRIQRRKTPYVTLQTYSLMFFQWLLSSSCRRLSCP